MTSESPSDLTRVYVWQIPVRLTHWLIALSVVVLAATGFYIGHPFIIVSGEARASFLMGWVKVVHFYAAIVFTLSVVSRVTWMFVGNKYARWDKFLPVQSTRRQGFGATLEFYLFARDRPPGYVGHNPLAGLTYSVVFLVYAVSIVTGLAMYGAYASVDSPLRWFAALAPWMGGLQTTRWIHHAMMWLLLGFVVHHVYSAVLMSLVEKTGTVESIVSGFKWVPRQLLELGPHRWVRRGEIDE
jgi:Ni/Fe-hydrogenase 1 B-type cytochrome subunit